MPHSPGHVFYDRLQSVLIAGGFDRFAEREKGTFYFISAFLYIFQCIRERYVLSYSRRLAPGDLCSVIAEPWQGGGGCAGSDPCSGPARIMCCFITHCYERKTAK